MREIRRRTRVVGAFPDGNSALILVSRPAAPRRRHAVGPQTLHGHGPARRPPDHHAAPSTRSWRGSSHDAYGISSPGAICSAISPRTCTRRVSDAQYRSRKALVLPKGRGSRSAQHILRSTYSCSCAPSLAPADFVPRFCRRGQLALQDLQRLLGLDYLSGLQAKSCPTSWPNRCACPVQRRGPTTGQRWGHAVASPPLSPTPPFTPDPFWISPKPASVSPTPNPYPSSDLPRSKCAKLDGHYPVSAASRGVSPKSSK